MQGLRLPSFLFTKKNPDTAGEVEGRMKTLASSLSMYFFILADSGCDNGKILPLGGVTGTMMR